MYLRLTFTFRSSITLCVAFSAFYCDAPRQFYNAGHETLVEFYGLVVAQDGNALSSVTLKLAVVEHYTDPFSEVKETVTHLQRQTGADGHFGSAA